MTHSQILLSCVGTLFPAWKQLDYKDALGISQSYVSAIKSGKKEFSQHVGNTIMLLLLDRLDQIIGGRYSYRELKSILKYYEDLHQDESLRPEERDESFDIALKIYKTGYYII